jgi:pimeloyl-ACP methyl ester carboxylesterase
MVGDVVQGSRSMRATTYAIPGELVTLPLPGRGARPLDGFLVPGPRGGRSLAVFVHGMGSNFYRSAFRKELMRQASGRGFAFLAFNNRGAEAGVATERFSDCAQDIQAAVDFGVRRGFRDVFLIGHSTGCQKIAYYQTARRSPRVRALVLAAIGDDYAIARRELGRRFGYWLAKARRLVAEGRGDALLPREACLGFSAARFLSVAERGRAEADLFDLEGPMRRFRRVRVPVLAVFPAREEYACMPVPRMAEIVRRTSAAPRCDTVIVPGADHGFHGAERATAARILRWLSGVRDGHAVLR